MEVQVVLIGAVAIAVVLLLTAGRARIRTRGPLGTQFDVEGSPDAPGIETRDVQAGRDLSLDDATGRGVRSKNLRAGRDVNVRARDPRA